MICTKWEWEGWFRPNKNKPQPLLEVEDELTKAFLRLGKCWHSAAKLGTKTLLQMCSILESKTMSFSLVQHILVFYMDGKSSKRLQCTQQYFLKNPKIMFKEWGGTANQEN